MPLRLTGVTDYVQGVIDALQPREGAASGRDVVMSALLTDLQTLETLELLYFQDGVTNSAKPNWSSVAIRGRSEPLWFYSDTDVDSWDFSFKLVASVDKSDGGTVEKNYRDWLFIKQAGYPDYAGNDFARPPHLFNLRWGRAMDEVGIIEDPQATFKLPYINELPSIIDVSFTFKRIGVPRGASDVRNLMR